MRAECKVAEARRTAKSLKHGWPRSAGLPKQGQRQRCRRWRVQGKVETAVHQRLVVALAANHRAKGRGGGQRQASPRRHLEVLGC